MKKATIFFYAFLTFVVVAHSQKVYQTKTAQIKFNASGGAETIAAQNNQGDSKLLEKTGQVFFGVLIKGFKFENELMEQHFNESYMESNKYPKAEFKGAIKNIATVDFTKDGVYVANAEGSFTMHGVTKPISVMGKLTVKGGKVSIKGDFKLKIKEYGIKGAEIGSVVSNEAEVSVFVNYN